MKIKKENNEINQKHIENENENKTKIEFLITKINYKKTLINELTYKLETYQNKIIETQK